MSDNDEVLRSLRRACSLTRPRGRRGRTCEHPPPLPRAQWDAFPDVRLTLDDVFSTDHQLACRFSIEGTHLGPFRGCQLPVSTLNIPASRSFISRIASA